MAKNLSPDYINWVVNLNTDQAQQEYAKLVKENKELEKSSRECRKQMTELVAAGKKNSAEYKALTAQVKANNKAVAENRDKMSEVSQRFDLSTMTAKQLRKHLSDLKRQFEDTSKATHPEKYKSLQQQIEATRRALDQATGSTGRLREGMGRLTAMKSTIVGFFAGIGASVMGLVTGAFRNAFSLVLDFEKQNAKLASVLGQSVSQIKDMETAARKLGATTSYSAAEVTGLQIELAKLGFQKQQIVDMEASILKFAKAVDTDLASAAAFTGAALRIFGKDASDAEDVLASFAVATTTTALDFSKLETSLSIVGPVANAFGMSLEDVTALLGSLANAGFDASSAATATRNILLKLCDANGDLAKALGGPVKNADDLAKGLQKLNAQGVDLAKALELTDKRSVAAFSTFLAGADSLVKVRDGITGVNKEFNQMAETTGGTVSTSLAALQSAAQELVLNLGRDTTGPIKEIVDGLTSMVGWIGKAIDFMKKHMAVIKATVAGWLLYKAGIVAVRLAHKAYGAFLAVHKGVMIAYNAVVTLLQGGFAGLKTRIQQATIAFKALDTATKVAKLGSVVGIITSIVGALYTFVKANNAAKDSVEELSEAEQAAKQTAEEHARKREELISGIETEKRKIAELVAVAEDETKSKEERMAAINELNRICPQYNGHLVNEGKLLKANKKALDDYIVSLEKRMRLAYYKDEYEQYIKEDEAAQRRLRKAQSEYELHKDEKRTLTPDGSMVRSRGELTSDPINTELFAATKEAQKTTLAVKDLRDEIEQAGFTTAEVLTNAQAETEKVTTAVKGTSKAVKHAKTEAEKAAESAEKNSVKKIKDQIKDLSKELQNAPKENNKALKDAWQKRMDAAKAFYDTQEVTIRTAVADGKITQEAADIYLLNQEIGLRRQQLKTLQDYLDNVKGAETMSQEEKEAAIAEINSKIRQTQNELLTATGQWSEAMREATTNAASPEGLRANLEEQLRAVESYYDAIIETTGAEGDSLIALQQERSRRIEDIMWQQKEKEWQLQEKTGTTWADEYQHELDELKHMHEQGLISEDKYQKERLKKGVKGAKQYYDYFSQLSSSMFTAIQDAEIAQSDAKYDVLIQQAKNNGEDTAELEQEKENEKLKIQKKYADVNFAIKVSQIIADTAVAIMQAYAQLGPIAGSVAAGMLTATGIAQMISAKAERDKIKNMEPGKVSSTSSSSTNSTNTADRVLSGYAEGGYTGDGKRYEVAGVVHRGEYVVPMPIMTHPKVVDAVGTIEAIRRGRGLADGGRGAARSGYAEGGYVGGSAAMQSGELVKAATELREALKNIRATVLYKDVAYAEKMTNKATSPFTKNS